MPTYDLWMMGIPRYGRKYHGVDERSPASFVRVFDGLPPATPPYKADAVLRYPSKAMHDLNYFRDHLDVFAEMAKRRGAVLDLDAFR